MGICKQLLPVYDKPMIYYPLSVLMLSGIRDILIISTPQDLPRFRDMFSNGAHLGLKLSYAEQAQPNGLAEAFIIGEKFIGNDTACLVLGDNIFHGHGLVEMLRKAVYDIEKEGGATVFGYYVNDPGKYGIAEFDNTGRVLSLEEKPSHPKSNYAVTGLYFYDNEVIKIAKSIRPSARGEIEITDVNKRYLEQNKLRVELLGRGFSWLDTGSHENLLEAAKYISIVERRQGLRIACIEEIAYSLGYINDEQLCSLAEPLKKNEYGQYLLKLLSQRM
jgi:glucose-1-phosphate thymidylyltransferase